MVTKFPAENKQICWDNYASETIRVLQNMPLLRRNFDCKWKVALSLAFIAELESFKFDFERKTDNFSLKKEKIWLILYGMHKPVYETDI